MGKLFLWVLVIIVALLVMRVVASRAAARNAVPRAKPEEASRARQDKRTSAKPTRGAPDPTLGASEPMVRCAHCGIHLPRSEALMKDGKTWCSDAHAQLGVRQV